MGSVENSSGYRPKEPKPTFVVENITHLKGERKVIKIFNYPILPADPSKGITAGKRDLMDMPGISVDTIELSLMSGSLKHKIFSKDIRIIESSIELIQFDEDFKQFLNDSGIEIGLDAGSSDGYIISELPYSWKMSIPLIGTKDGINRIFYTPDQFISGVFLDNQFAINIFHNGRRLNESSVDFTISKSNINNIDYDVINFKSFKPINTSVLIANYVVRTN